MATTYYAKPDWYTDDDDNAWEKVKAAFRRDWQQTKHDMGGDAPDLDQHVGDTIAQAAGTKPIPPGNAKTAHPDDGVADVYDEDDEPAYRYGYAASRHFHDRWDEGQLRSGWGDDADFERRRRAIRRGWKYGRINDSDTYME